VSTNEPYLAAIDLGGSKVAVLISNIEGKIISRCEEPLNTSNGSFIPRKAQEAQHTRSGVDWYGPASQIEHMLRGMLKESGISNIAAIGIGSAGPLQSGGIRNPPNFAVSVPQGMPSSFLFVPLIEPLKKAFSAVVVLENDCNTAVLGEAFFGVGQGVEDKESLHLVYVTMSTGLGAGVWSGGHLLLGKDGNAAEVGHILVKESGLRCGCGNDGCAEAYCSGRGMVQNTRIRLVNKGLRLTSPLTNLIRQEALKINPQLSIPWQLLEFVTPQLVFRAAQEGDELAKNVLDDFIHYGGIALSAIANAYDPAIITLGGSIAVNHPEIVDPMHKEMCLHLNVSPPDVRITPLAKRAVEYGAIVLAHKASS
jgi:glucokinase